MADRIIIADDHPLFREGVARNVKRLIPDATIEQAATVDEVEALAQSGAAPRVIVLDLCFPGVYGTAHVTRLRQAFPSSVIVVVSMLERHSIARQAIAAGANAFIGKGVPARQFCDTLMAACAGQVLVCLPSQGARQGTAPLPLTPRQQDVLRLITAGKSNKEIARELGISPFTVRIHVSALFKALGVASRTEAALRGLGL
ncbi:MULTISPECIES: response regulator transcription factor [unclassified Pseudomonas]|uniref:LuxR C-terminal-related transcriptional regulator n=1 Tax=unclassified Pseudomonas TaxID=196821 RepID=UPI000BDD3F5F|nr:MULTISPECIES: response regulator transcription factor [unclassified Pseudomonas]PVZ11474.1 DNA-binding NarL/FixJ family response regulator [Pseudomonas sp. URIL14HWK12:I12]PVZ22472.1 DNA-binding NarL/FixJ family response regulator [Pseudomonas sp. URIL14HWK12:I10]PVZ31404.1 DNA-binding NarL/FixJ family response regulator [Pseudomonas sp. URIL14HWK12:I11]SNZ16177.1 DNA-binding response regulator, NarL/FixJ family, contains REC and HTH domains [Pseudomonas sp. URIL14HWK12:I9]